LKFNKQHSYLYPTLIGIMTFFTIAGPRFLDPTNIAWLVGGDPLQHYLGWAFFRHSPWTWPIGLNPAYGMDFSNSIVFTDSIPLLAIPFKVIAFFLPEPFQYLGIWVLLCFVLQAYFAFRLIGLITNRVSIQCLGCILFVFSPPLIFRLSLHESLMGHFIILAALYLNLRPRSERVGFKLRNTQPLAWALLLSIAVLTHFYLAVMALVLWLADLCTRVSIAKKVSYKDAAFEILAIVILLGFMTWQVGYFAIEGASGATRGFGDFRTNLLALFNSRGWSYWLKPIPLRDSVEAATGEGFQFLGAGSLFLVFTALYALIRRKIHFFATIQLVWKNYPYLVAALVVLSFISFSNYIGLGPWNVRIPFPDFLISVLSFVRASSRLFWPMYYALILAAIYVVIKSYGSKATLFIFLISAIIQILDTSAGWLEIRERVAVSPASTFNSMLKNPFWQDAGRKYRNVVTNDGQGNWENFGVFAASNRMATNMTYLARVDTAKQSEFSQRVGSQLYSGPLNSDTLYILREWKNAPDKENYSSIQYQPQIDLLASIDGFNVLAPGWKNCKSCLKIDESIELKQLAPSLKIGEIVQFTKASNGRSKFMLNGWGYTEDWGTWAIEPSAKIVLPIPDGSPVKLIISANAFLTPSHLEQKVDIYINGIKVTNQLALTKQTGNTVELLLPPEIKPAGKPVSIEFRSINPISPLVAGISGDDRRLGIGLVSIQFVR
jgi:hypothetical protein